MAILDADQLPTPQERLDELEAEIAFLREMVRSLISRFPADPVKDGPMYGAVKAFNEASRSLPKEKQAARDRAYEKFGLQHIHRAR